MGPAQESSYLKTKNIQQVVSKAPICTSQEFPWESSHPGEILFFFLFNNGVR